MHIRTTIPPCKTERRAGSAPRARTRSPAPAAATFAASLSVGALSTALAGPTGGVVVEGQGSISNPSASSTVIEQGSQRLTLNWSTFNVGANESVQFNQPSSTALALNRILDQNPSQIFGSLRANGQVVLVNPNGLLIGRSAQLNVNSLVASSLDAIDFDAGSGRYRFSTSRNDVGAVINEGSITAGPGGSVTLLGGRVSNTGSIVADFGTVNLAAGRAATLDLAGDGLLRLEVSSDLLSNGGGTSAVENSGTIQVNGGQVLLTANAVQDVFANLVNNTGVVRANRIDNTGGTIRLLGPDGVVQSSGTLDASAGDATSTGGAVSVLGDRVGLVGNAIVDVSGSAGGGSAWIGGDYQGSNANVLNATRTYVGSGVTLNADAGATGDGGRIIVWSNEDTHYYGQLTARGGALSGNGGFAEVSGKRILDFTGGSNLTAAHGSWGTLLLDPDSISIEQGAAAVPGGRFGDQDWSVAEDSGSGVVPIDPQQIENLLDANVLALHASQDITSDADADINVSGDAGAAGHSLTLDAGGAMSLQGDIRLNNGALILTTGTGDLTVSGLIDTNGGAATFSTGAAGKITLSNSLTTNDGQIDLTAGTGGIDLQDGSVLNASDGDINLTSDGTVRLTALTATGPGVITIDAAGAITDDTDSATRVVAPRVELTSGATMGSSVNRIGTNATTLTAIANAGNIFIAEQDGVTLEHVQATDAGTTGAVNVTSGDTLVVEDVQAFQNVTLTSAGAILGTATMAGISSQTGKVTLDAADNIGTVGGGATAVRIAQAASLSALSDDATNGAINLRLPAGAAVTVAAGDIRLGSNPAGTGRSGTVLLQTTGALDASGFASGAINIGGSNSVTVNMTATGALVLPAGVNFTDQPASTLFLQGTDITDSGPGNVDANEISLTAIDLNFRATNAPSDKTLNTVVDRLDALLGGANRSLTVAEQAGGTSQLTLGAISATGNVTISAPGGLFDDGAATAVAGDLVTLSGPSLGLQGNELDTSAAALSINATNGAAYVRQAAAGGDVDLLFGHALDIFDLATANGGITVSGGVSTTIGGEISLVTNSTAPGTPRNLVINNTINGSGGAVTLTANPAGSSISFDSNISGGSITMTAGAAVPAGTISAVGAPTLIASGLLSMTGSTIGLGNRILTNVGSLTTRSLAGGTFITETDGVSVDAIATGGPLDILAGGVMTVNQGRGAGVTLATNGVGSHLTIDGVVNAGAGTASLTTNSAANVVINDTVDATGAVTLTAGPTGNITVNDDVTSTTSSVSLTAGTAGNWGAITSAAGAEASGSSVTAQAGSIGTSDTVRFNTSTNTLNLTSQGGNIFAQESGATTLNASALGGALDVATSDGLLNVSAASGTGVTLETNGPNRNLLVNGTINGNGAAVVLTATGAISGAGQVLGSSLNASGTSIGSSGARLATNVDTLNTTSTGAGGTFITEADGATLTGSAVGGGALDVLVTSGSLIETAAAGNGVTLVAGGAGSTLTLNGAVVGGAGPVTLSASGAGGNIDLKNTVSTTGAVSVTAGTAGARGLLTIDPASVIAGGAVTVAAQSIGTSGNRLRTAATSLDATSSNGDIYVDQTGALTSLTATATGAVDVIGNAALASGGGSVTGTSFTATATSIGSSASRLATNVGTLNTTSTGAGGTFITEADGVTLTGSATGGGALDVQTTAGTLDAASIDGNGIRLVAGGAGSNLNVSSAVAGGSGDVTLAAIGDNGNVSIGGSVNTTGDVTITAGSVADRGVITLGGGGGTVNGDDVVVAAESIGTSGGPLVTAARTLNATSSNGGIFVRDTDGLDLTANATGGTVSAETLNGALRVLGAAGDGVTLTAGGIGNGITVDGAVDGRAGNVTLNAQGDGAAIALNSTVTTSANVQLTAGSSNARGAIAAGAGNQVNASGLVALGSSIGASGARLDTAVDAMDLTSTNGGAFVTEADGLTLTANASGGALDVQTTNGVLNVNGVAGNGVTLSAGGAANDLNINGSVAGGAGDVALSAAGAGSAIHLNALVSTTGNATLTAGTAGTRGAIVAGAGQQINANELTATGASIGTSSVRLATTVSSLNTTSTNGATFVTESDELTLTANATGGAVDVATTNGALTVASASGDGVSLVTNGVGNDLNVNGPVSGGASDVTLLANGAGSNLRLAGAIGTTANVSLTAGTSASRGAIITDAGNGVAANALAVVGTSIGTSSFALNTTVGSLDATATAGNIRVIETDDLDLTAHATGGSLDVRTLGSRIDVASASGEGVTLIAAGNGPLVVNGPVNGGGGAVTLTSGGAMTLDGDVTTTGGVRLTSGLGSDITLNAALTGGNVEINAGFVGNFGDLVAGVGHHVTADQLTLLTASVGSTTAHLNTTASSIDARTSNGGIFIDEADALDLTATATGGTLDVRTANGALTAVSVVGDGVTLATGGDGHALTLNAANLSSGVQGRAGSVSLTTSGVGSDIVLNDTVQSTSNIVVAANGNGSNVRLNSVIGTDGNLSVTAGSTAARGAITGDPTGTNLVASSMDLVGASIGASNARLNTGVATLNAASTNGGIFISEANGVAVNANATGGALDIIAGGAIDVAAANGNGVTLATSAPGSAIHVNGAINGGAGAVTLTAGGAITGTNGGGITAASLTAAGSSIGSAANRLSTTVASLNATSTNGGTFVTETDGLALNANVTGGALDVQTINGALTVTGAAASTVTLTAGGAGSGIGVNGAVNAGTGDVTLTAGTTASGGAITGTAGGRVTGGTLTALASSIGTSAAPLNTTIDALNANAGTGDIAISEQNGLRLTDVRAGGSVSVTSASGDITVNVVNATNTAALTASAGAIADDGDDTTRLVARDVTLLARSIGGASTVTGTTLDSTPRLDISATTLDATSSSGGIFIDELDGLTRVSAHASGGAAGDIELLTTTGDLNLQSVGASDSLLLAAGRDILGLPGLGAISARAAELRAGGADSNAGHIGSLSQPFNLQLAAGNTLRLFVPQTVDPNDASRAPATLPSPGVLTTLSLFGAPNALSLQAGFGQFSGTGDTQFTSPAESLVRTIQNQTGVVQSVVGLDWASFDANVSLFGTLDPAVCLPSDQRDEEQGGAGC